MECKLPGKVQNVELSRSRILWNTQVSGSTFKQDFALNTDFQKQLYEKAGLPNSEKTNENEAEVLLNFKYPKYKVVIQADEKHLSETEGTIHTMTLTNISLGINSIQKMGK